MVKPRSQQATIQKKTPVDDKAISALADKIADKPYGQPITGIDKPDPKSIDDGEELERITITLPQNIRYLLDDIARDRKRTKQPNRTVSAVVREALEDYFAKK